eukprot:979390-Pelagomonas_calceolata.AAC.5
MRSGVVQLPVASREPRDCHLVPVWTCKREQLVVEVFSHLLHRRTRQDACWHVRHRGLAASSDRQCLSEELN